MKSAKRKKLESAGWKVGSAAEFLDLSSEEVLLVAMKLALAAGVRDRRRRLKLTQQELAARIGSSQSRVAKIESADKSVSMDLLVRSLASLGASPKDIADIISARQSTKKRSKGLVRQLAAR